MSEPNNCTVPPGNKPMSLELARALAEAADGLAKDDKAFFLVARYAPISDDFAGGFVVWGPYADFDAVTGKPREEVCAKTAGFFGPFQFNPAPLGGNVVKTVELTFADGLQFPFPTRPDALFFTPSAVEKFALPYYERIFGPEFGAKVRDDFANVPEKVMAHYPWSEYSDGTRVPAIPVFLRVEGSVVTLVARDLKSPDAPPDAVNVP